MLWKADDKTDERTAIRPITDEENGSSDGRRRMFEGRMRTLHCLSCLSRLAPRGIFKNDVQTYYGEGVVRNLHILQMNSTDGLREMQTMGRKGVKNSLNFAVIICEWPPGERGGRGRRAQRPSSLSPAKATMQHSPRKEGREGASRTLKARCCEGGNNIDR